ncbi:MULTISPECIES: DUF350 domain-containing protein [Mycobacterium]|uniref:DUF350 domain-containing protein n=3 Tax=Mycobacterium TaxID=1763 RepID=A0A1Q4HPH2_9MYCO|nr:MULTISPECIES: DUF350 domain-containing protein [Mycobacterium]OBG57055.1 hypothetical protein A5704_23435 [Mycobacterium sp. E735]OBG57324.1 hypothetical protein A5703_00500 [Mycobacterium sp. E188]OBG78604.1 hypothetical protein A5701_15830 [Mycobacterium sp. E3305]OBH24143.1 hypothetical protein A9X03_01815 [Mycobacterium sp. E1715]OBH44517.1 hypothetical protein A5691_00990 [Mycobacterium sp. E183]
MYLAIDFGSTNLGTITQGVVAVVLYFAVGVVVLIAGFLMVDVLTPGNLRQLVFIDKRPNAVVLASAMYIALAIVIISAIASSYSQLGQGLVGVAVYGLVGVVLQGGALLILQIAVPGKFREHVDEPELHPAAFATATMLVAVGGVIAAAIS